MSKKREGLIKVDRWLDELPVSGKWGSAQTCWTACLICTYVTINTVPLTDTAAGIGKAKPGTGLEFLGAVVFCRFLVSCYLTLLILRHSFSVISGGKGKGALRDRAGKLFSIFWK